MDERGRNEVRLTTNEWHRWQREVSRIKEDLQGTINDRAIFQDFAALVRENGDWIDEHNGGYFTSFVARSYVARVALGVRRQVKSDKNSLSLSRLLHQIRTCAPQLTFEFFLKQFPRDPDYVPWQEPTFRYLSKDGRVVSEIVLASDLKSIVDTSGKVEAYADRMLAHLDKRGFDGSLAFTDLDRSIDKLDKVACKYICFLLGHYHDTLKATVQFNWKRIFGVPWQKPT
jgi:hypothetical protein